MIRSDPWNFCTTVASAVLESKEINYILVVLRSPSLFARDQINSSLLWPRLFGSFHLPKSMDCRTTRLRPLTGIYVGRSATVYQVH